MIFKNVKSLSVPEGVVTRITSGGVILWKNSNSNYQDIYQKVDYITSSGTQYIITDFIADNQSGMELIASFPTILDRVPMGSRLDSGTTRFYVPYPMSDTSCYYGFNTGSTLSFSASTNTKYQLQTNFCNNRKVRMYTEGTLILPPTNISTTLTQQTSPVGIFVYTKGAGGVGAPRAFDLYGAKISQGSEVVREYIPCYRKSDNVVGVYEIYTNTFLTNSGSGEFEIGNEIDW